MPIGISHILLPSLLRALETPTQGEAHRQVTLVALAVERFRAAHGTLPKSLEELAPTGITVEITDPYDGSPLRYIPRDSEFIVYSVGSDQKDDGGTPGRRDEGDIVFTVRRAAAPAQ